MRLNILDMKQFLCSQIIHVSIKKYASCVKIFKKSQSNFFIHFETHVFLLIFCFHGGSCLELLFWQEKFTLFASLMRPATRQGFEESNAIWYLCYYPYFTKPPSFTLKSLFLLLNITGKIRYIYIYLLLH